MDIHDIRLKQSSFEVPITKDHQEKINEIISYMKNDEEIKRRLNMVDKKKKK